MKNLLLISLLIFLSACSARQYHYAALNETTISSKQLYHIRQLKKLGVVSGGHQQARSSQQVCYTYPPALGGYTSGCQAKVQIR